MINKPISNSYQFGKKTVLLTISSKDYISFSRTLIESVFKIHPEFKSYLCLVDEIDGYFNPDLEKNCKVILSNSLNIENFNDMKVRYNIVELNTAVKPYAIKWLFDNLDIDYVIYLDSDIYLFSRLDQLFKEFLQGASIILTPHILYPLEDGYNPDDHSMLKSGIFNLGFIAIRRCPESLEFLDWWSRRLETQCTTDLTNNLFQDQKWCDLAPAFLNDLKILRNEGYNVAYWNLRHRIIKKNNDLYTVNGKPLVFFHFSGINPSKKEQVSKHQDRFSWYELNNDCKDLFVNYSNNLMNNGWETALKWPYAYDFIDGIYISPIIRKLYQNTYKIPNNFINNNDIKKCLIELCNSFSLTNNNLITNLMYYIYKSRIDLQNAFNLLTQDGSENYLQWYLNTDEKDVAQTRLWTNFIM